MLELKAPPLTTGEDDVHNYTRHYGGRDENKKLREALEDIARVAKKQEQPYCEDRAKQALEKLKRMGVG